VQLAPALPALAVEVGRTGIAFGLEDGEAYLRVPGLRAAPKLQTETDRRRRQWRFRPRRPVERVSVRRDKICGERVCASQRPGGVLVPRSAGRHQRRRRPRAQSSSIVRVVRAAEDRGRRAREVAERPQAASPRRHQAGAEGAASTRHFRERVETPHGWQLGKAPLELMSCTRAEAHPGEWGWHTIEEWPGPADQGWSDIQ
jgi:hypothetical protein